MSRKILNVYIQIFAFDKVIAFITHILCERLTPFNPNATAVALDNFTAQSDVGRDFFRFGIDSRPAFATIPQ
jgi:hypothetical protein